MRKTFLYYLFSENKKPLYVDDLGFVQEGTEDLMKPDGQPAALQYSPANWRELQIKYVRNIQFWGLVRDVALALQLMRDGAKILQDRKWRHGGTEAVCQLGILKLDPITLPYRYLSYYLSDINFAKHKENETSVLTEAMEAGMSRYFKANQNTVYELPIDTDPQHINILFDSQKLDFSRTLEITSGQELFAVPNYFLGMVEVTREGNVPDLQWQDIIGLQAGPYPNNDWYMSYYKINAAYTSFPFTIEGNITVRFEQNDTFILRVEVNDGSGASSTQTTLVSTVGSPRPAGTVETFNFSATYNIPDGHRAHMKIFTGSNTGVLKQMTVLGGQVKISYVYIHRATYVKGHFPKRVLELLAGKMSENRYGISSAWLTAMKDKAIVSGDSLRGIVTDNSNPASPVKGAVIKTNTVDFYKSFFARYGAALGTTSTELTFEKLNSVFTSNVIMDVGAVDKAELVDAEELMGNVIQAGYAKQDYTDANGRFEMNQGQTWTTPGTKVVKEIDLVSPYRADAFGMELLRVNFDGKDTSDSSSDNDTFIVDIEPTPYTDNTTTPATIYYKLNRPAYSSVAGIPHPDTAYNTELTPKKGILNLGPYLRSLFDQMDAGQFKLSKGDKNTEFSTVLSGVTVTEKDPITIGSLGDRYFLPYYITFTCTVPVNIQDLVKQAGKIKFTWNKQDWYGYIMDISVKPADNDVQVWKVLSAPENNLSKFNNYG